MQVKVTHDIDDATIGHGCSCRFAHEEATIRALKTEAIPCRAVKHALK